MATNPKTACKKYPEGAYKKTIVRMKRPLGCCSGENDDADDFFSDDPPSVEELLGTLHQLQVTYGTRLTAISLPVVGSVFVLPSLPRAEPMEIYYRVFKPVCLACLGRPVAFEEGSLTTQEMPVRMLRVICPNTLVGVLAGSCTFDNDGKVINERGLEFWRSVFKCFDALLEIYATTTPSPYVPRDIVGRITGRSELDLAEQVTEDSSS